MTAAFAVQDGMQRTNVIHVAAERGIILELQSKFYGSDQRRRGHITERVLGHAGDVNHEGDAAAGPYVNWRTAASDAGQRVPYRMRQPHRILRDAGSQRSSGAGHEQNGRESRFAIFLDARHRFGERSGQFFLYWPQRFVEFEISVVLT